MKITANKSVSAEYELYVDGETEGELELMERATAEQPLSFIYGVGMMLPKFEENIFGLATGDKFDFTIENEDAYGPYEDENVLDLDRSIFEIDGKLDEEVVFEGNVVPLMDNEGHRINAQVVEVTDTHVKVDLNHPLAGENLHFKGSILEVREASEKELAALQGGGGCGCGSGGCGDEGCGCDDGEEGGSCGSGCGCH
ncbi:MAG: FKBP-type peptidyl-prolyl cis-trans isomerase [Paludibacter sp.]|jgi:FKBP-type peptidyl-prolyl cis-trans isomerase SlyD|nr:FKBP-type peptidyl-prolyl cis-trans isomerase [Paludibacter sp.]MBP6356118.1 FKBP-type peptidyl-prolyl cis-trans isomerase [Paludibacter sp.]MBP6635640.1 FKBP-type peptidyl-prolyl cis-trans isomerase [Paludibacter sp.]MEA4851535.1 FKBP-type peptidyl-prolyl cis-trans isomerase [Paludibacter sp.]